MKYFLLLFLFFVWQIANADVITGEISKQSQKNINQIYDAHTNIPLEGALIKIPSKHYSTKTDKDGTFSLKTQINSPTIMSIEKSGYKPYSMTLTDNSSMPIQIGIEKTSPKDIIVETNMVHIGDNSYSDRSANADEFSLFSSGAFYSKDFNIKQMKPTETLFMIIGSIIGIDTSFAQRLGQSRVLTAYSSPPEIFFNGNKISDIKINGDNQKIQIPFNLIKFNQMNNITIKTGRNLQKISSVDLDDIEFTNIMFEVR